MTHVILTLTHALGVSMILVPLRGLGKDRSCERSHSEPRKVLGGPRRGGEDEDEMSKGMWGLAPLLNFLPFTTSQATTDVKARAGRKLPLGRPRSAWPLSICQPLYYMLRQQRNASKVFVISTFASKNLMKGMQQFRQRVIYFSSPLKGHPHRTSIHPLGEF
ncbi:hypothetical protein J6590_028678 [Homalodisca vitripennis]|nr:hypothetical protein J6590_028678 [Homalodisca vitripennis]